MGNENYSLDFSFFEYLKHYYKVNRGKIRRNYKDLTKKFLDYNDKEYNPDAFLRKPQFEALEMYIFIKEFFDNAQVIDLFEGWRNREEKFNDDSYYSLSKVDGTGQGQFDLYDMNADQVKDLFKRLKKVKEDYPNYIYALTMGLGKTILMATCIFYEFLLANKYPKDKRFCHNALVFAPDRTVLESLREIMTFDKTLVVPPEYANVLDTNIKFHFLQDTGTTLHSLDDSDFNIIISNTQKIIVKKRRKKETPTNSLFNMGNTQSDSKLSGILKDVYGDADISTEDDLILNQRFTKLCRLPQLGVYVDEAHHMFGTELEKSLHDSSKDTSLRSTINLLSKQLERENSMLVACYNYTGTPYVKNKILPEVVYSYGLADSISNGYLKRAERFGYENVKNEEFIRSVITNFWDKYGDNIYEGLAPKLAIFSTRHEELISEVLPVVEEVLAELGIPRSKILINIGDSKVTRSEDIRDFNNLDVPATAGAEKQFILLVDKGREGWNCKSLFGVALFREPNSRVFVLQATMRSLRKITDIQQEATIYLSKKNMDILEEELSQNFRVSLDDLNVPKEKRKQSYAVRLVPPPKYIDLKELRHIYSLDIKEYNEPIDFKLDKLNYEKYEASVYIQKSMTIKMSTIKENADHYRATINYSELTLTAEISKYLNISCIKINKMLKESVDGIEKILSTVSKYNDILYDVIIPKIFQTLYEVKCRVESVDKKVTLLREPKDSGYYSFTALPEMVRKNTDNDIQQYVDKSFHADTYCFDSKPERELFMQYLLSDKVKKIYFTGMFTGNQGDLSIQYYDPESNRIRNYYPDFLAQMEDGSYELIEVKGDNKIDDEVVLAKAKAAHELAAESNMVYKIYPGSKIMSTNILSDANNQTDLFNNK